MSQISDLLKIASAEIGVAEDPLGSNNIKYNTAYYGREVSGDSYPWCMVFVWWCFREAGLSSLFYGGGKTASCTTLMNWAKQQGQFVTGGYQAGDVFLYQFDDDSYADHTGIYTGEKDSKGRYFVIEGNHNDRVETVTRADNVLWGAFRAKWVDNTPEPQKPSEGALTLPQINYGDIGPTVKAMQILLQGYGCKLPKYGADGEYGSETRTALKKYQLNKGLIVDGICGESTWAKLLGLN